MIRKKCMQNKIHLANKNFGGYSTNIDPLIYVVGTTVFCMPN